MVKEFSFLVDGKWRTSSDKYELKNPYNGELVAIVNRARPQDIEEAVSAAQKAFITTREMPAYKKSLILARMAAGIKERKEEFAQAMALECGKPITDCRAEVERAITTFTVASEEAKRIGGEVLPLDIVPSGEGRLAITRRFPLGPITGITPFNFPLNLVAHKVAPCLASGNTMLLRPASQTPLCSLLLEEVAVAAGVPAGALNVVPCSTEVADPLITDERIKMLTFTGSPEVGWGLKAKAGKKKVLLELGGNAGVIINGDADLNHAALRCAKGGFYYAGQSCISVQRILVKDEVYHPFLDRLVDYVKMIKVGDPLDEATEMGPVITSGDADRIQAWINEALAAGAKLVIGGERDGQLLHPAVLVDTTSQMKVNCLEVFAPLVTVAPFARFEEAVAMVNDSIYGLQTGIFTNDMQAVLYAYHELEVGGVIVNDVPTFRVDHMPYGGVKNSGFGREGLKYAIEEMTELKLLALNWG